MMHFGGGGGGGWMWHWYRDGDEADKASFSRAVLKRVLEYARPYRWHVALMLFTVFVLNLIGLVPPLLMRDLIDNALPNRDAGRLNLLALAMVAVTPLTGLIG